MSDWMDEFPDKFGKLFLIFIWFAAIFIFVNIFAAFAYNAFHTPPEFHKLDVMSGVLTNVGMRIDRKSTSYIPIAIIVNGSRKEVKLPFSQQISSLKDEIGEVIEIRSDPGHISYLADDLNVWHVASKMRIYFDYNKAVKRAVKRSNDDRNIIYISVIFTLILVIKNYHALRDYVSKVLTGDKPTRVEPDDELLFEPSNIYYGFMFWLVSIPTIMCGYNGLFLHPFFLSIAALLILCEVWLYGAMRRNTYQLRISPVGIQYEPFKKVTGSEAIRWEEIENIDTFSNRYGRLIIIRLYDKSGNKSFLSKLSCKLTINALNFTNYAFLEETLFQKFSSFKGTNIDESLRRDGVSEMRGLPLKME